MVAPQINAYSVGAKMLAEQVIKPLRACVRTSRRRHVCFAVACCVIGYAGLWAATTVVSFLNRYALCNLTYCDPATTARDKLFIHGISWTVIALLTFTCVAAIIRIGLQLRIHEDVVWSIPSRKLTMRYGKSLTTLFDRTNKVLTITFWVTAALVFGSALTLSFLLIASP